MKEKNGHIQTNKSKTWIEGIPAILWLPAKTKNLLPSDLKQDKHTPIKFPPMAFPKLKCKNYDSKS